MTLSSPKCGAKNKRFFKSLGLLALAALLACCASPAREFRGDKSYEPASRRPVNINTAGRTELQTLPGIGPRTAEKIIVHREEFGRFRSAPQLMLVDGIGEKQFLKVRKMVRTE